MTRRRKALLLLATAAGYALGYARRPVPYLPELAGLAFVSWGVSMIYVPAGVIAAGVALLLVGSQIPRSR